MRPTHPAHRRLISWMAMLAILMAGLAPAVSQAMRGGSAKWVEVCTVLGSTWVQVDDSGSTSSGPGPAPPHGANKPCVYASLFAAGFAPAPTLPHLVLPPLRFDAPRSVSLPSARPIAWLAAQPRGPPLLLA